VSRTRLDDLRAMRDFLDREILAELGPRCHEAIEKAADLYDVTTSDVLGRGRQRQVTQARQAAAWLMRREGRSFRDIGNALGYDHTTAMHAFRKVEATPALRAILAGLEVAA
jgi:chromosomal replication initiation ATPase DnaA